MFSPVGAWGQTAKIAPPLTIEKEAVMEGIAVLNEALVEAKAEQA
jgi:4-aminobutyrate aminotransferase-like enzyme